MKSLYSLTGRISFKCLPGLLQPDSVRLFRGDGKPADLHECATVRTLYNSPVHGTQEDFGLRHLRKRLELRGREAGILHPGEPAHLGERGSMIRVLIVDDQELFGESLKVSARTLRWPARLLACRRR